MRSFCVQYNAMYHTQKAPRHIFLHRLKYIIYNIAA